jgi:hypothetical protein
MLITLFGAVGCFVVGSGLLMTGMLTGRDQLTKIGTGLIAVVTVVVVAVAVAERQPLLPVLRSRRAMPLK